MKSFVDPKEMVWFEVLTRHGQKFVGGPVTRQQGSDWIRSFWGMREAIRNNIEEKSDEAIKMLEWGTLALNYLLEEGSQESVAFFAVAWSEVVAMNTYPCIPSPAEQTSASLRKLVDEMIKEARRGEDWRGEEGEE